jgi:hypothetical protein
MSTTTRKAKKGLGAGYPHRERFLAQFQGIQVGRFMLLQKARVSFQDRFISNWQIDEIEKSIVCFSYTSCSLLPVFSHEAKLHTVILGKLFLHSVMERHEVSVVDLTVVISLSSHPLHSDTGVPTVRRLFGLLVQIKYLNGEKH